MSWNSIGSRTTISAARRRSRSCRARAISSKSRARSPERRFSHDTGSNAISTPTSERSRWCGEPMAGTAATKGMEAIAGSARPLRGEPDDYAELFAQIADARVVLLGEATHGTREFYAERSRITQALIERFGFDAVAVEADWPDAY